MHLYSHIAFLGFGVAVSAAAANQTNATTTAQMNGTATASISLGATAQPSATGMAFTAHPDGQCMNPLNGTSNIFPLDKSQGFPNFTTLKAPSFPGAEAATGGGWDVYWSIPQPDAGCRYQVMLPYRQSSGTPGYPGGNEIINVGRQGCFFGNVPTDSDVYLSYCCGSADCQKASLNSTSLLSNPLRRRRSAIAERQRSRDTLDLERVGAPSDALRSGMSSPEDRDEPLAKSVASLPSRASELLSRFWYNPGPTAPAPSCKIIEPGQPYSRAGQQIVVGASELCTTSPCSVAVSYTISYSTTATSSKTDTFTTSAGVSISMEAGVDFIADAKLTTTVSAEISNAIAKATGKDVMHGNSSTVTNTVSLSLGNRGSVTFTPVYQCITGPLDCGNGTSGPIDFCQPDLSGINGSPAGDYFPLVSD